MNVSASLVLYRNPPEMFLGAIESFLRSGAEGPLVVVDNSETSISHPVFADRRIVVLSSGSNLGFGRAHNLALKHLDGRSRFHLILNPDVTFEAPILERLCRFMEADDDIGAVMPQIRFPDGSLQRLAKLLPSPTDLIFRRFVPSAELRAAINRRYELQHLRQDVATDVPSLSGCFLLARTRLLDDLGGFDDRYFMYMEDVDLVRRIGDRARTVYVPFVSVTHAYAKGSYRNRRLLWLHLRSALQYFGKWGWVFDSVRSRRNAQTLARLNGMTGPTTPA